MAAIIATTNMKYDHRIIAAVIGKDNRGTFVILTWICGKEPGNIQSHAGHKLYCSCGELLFPPPKKRNY